MENHLELIDGYCVTNTTGDEQVLARAGAQRFTPTRGMKEMALHPLTPLEAALNAKFPAEGYNNSGDDYFIIDCGGCQYLVLVHAGQWFLGNWSLSLDGTLIDREEEHMREIKSRNAESAACAISLLKKLPWVTDASYDPDADMLCISNRLFPNAGVFSALVHLCSDYGYYTIRYESRVRTYKCAGMFTLPDGELQELCEEVCGYDSVLIAEPSWLREILSILDEADRDPSWIQLNMERTV